jgi:hypothetical protein
MMAVKLEVGGMKTVMRVMAPRPPKLRVQAPLMPEPPPPPMSNRDRILLAMARKRELQQHQAILDARARNDSVTTPATSSPPDAIPPLPVGGKGQAGE